MDLGWMAWTWPTAAFFVAVAVLLAVMTWLERRWPTRPRRGWLPLATTRGDRLFISLLLAGFVHAGWLAVTDVSVLGASLISLLLAAALLRWG
jgi:predicted small integral membrane protein